MVDYRKTSIHALLAEVYEIEEQLLHIRNSATPLAKEPPSRSSFYPSGDLSRINLALRKILLSVSSSFESLDNIREYEAKNHNELSWKEED